MKSSNSILKLTFLKIAGAILGIGSSIIQVRLFGTSKEVEAFFASSSLVYLIVSFSQGGQLAELFLPIYHNLKKEYGDNAASKAFSVVVNHVLLFLLVFSILAFIFAPFLIDLMVPGFDISTKILAIQIFRTLLCFLVLQVINSFITTVLNAERIYGKAESASLLNTVINVSCIVLFYKILGIWALVYALLLGILIEFIYSLVLLRKINLQYFFSFNAEGFEKKKFFSAIFRTFSYVSATQVYNIILNASISFLPQGSYAIFQYVQNLFSKISNILIQPIITVFFTNISMLNSQSDTKQFRSLSFNNLSIFFILSVFVLTMFSSIGRECIQIIWGGRKFDKEAIDLAYYLFFAFFITFLFQGAFAIYRKMSVALGMGKIVYTYSTLSMLLSAILTYFFLNHFGLNGLFIVILFAKGFFMIVPVIIIFIFQRQYFIKPDLEMMVKVLLAGILSTIIAGFVKEILSGGLNEFQFYFQFISSGITGIVVFCVLLWILNVKIFRETMNVVFKKLINTGR